MSLLFDALNRAQSRDAEPLPLPDATLHLPSGDGAAEPMTEAAQALSAVTNKPPSTILTYALGGLTLLVMVAAWYYYQLHRFSPVATPQPILARQSPPAAAPASSVTNIASEMNRQLAAASPAAGSTEPAVNTPSTAPAVNKRAKHTLPSRSEHAKKRPDRPQPARVKPALSSGSNPLQSGYRALSEGRLDQAEQHYLAVLDQHPHEKDALLGLAVIAQRKLQTQRATDLYQQVLHEDMGNATAAAGLVSLSVQTDPQAAESQLKGLIDIQPTAAEFHYALGGVLARQLRWGEAQQAFFHAHSLAPDNPLYAYNLAVSLEHLHQPAAALPFYEKAFRLSAARDPTLDRDAIGRRIKQLEIRAPADSP
jgi:tetratricopeptide (TPR) repeat protein